MSTIEEVEVLEAWLDKSFYQNIVLQEETVYNNTLIPAGVPLSQVFPEGLSFAVAEGRVFDVRGESRAEFELRMRE